MRALAVDGEPRSMILDTLVLLAVLGVTMWCSWSAARHYRGVKREVSELTAGIEERTSEGERSPTTSAVISADLAELLDAAIASNVRTEAIVAVNEITSRASLSRFENRTLSRGLPKIALSAGLAGAFGLAALGSFDKRALVLAVGSFSLGFLGSVSARVSLGRGRKAALHHVSIAEVLADQVSARWPEEERR